MGFIANYWQDYRKAALADNIPPAILDQCRKAFYAGACSLHEIMSIGMSEEPGITEEDMDLVNGLELELREFANQTIQEAYAELHKMHERAKAQSVS